MILLINSVVAIDLAIRRRCGYWSSCGVGTLVSSSMNQSAGVNTDVLAAVLEKNLLAITSQYFGWTVPFLVVLTFVIDTISCGVDSVTSGSNVV